MSAVWTFLKSIPGRFWAILVIVVLLGAGVYLWLRLKAAQAALASSTRELEQARKSTAELEALTTQQRVAHEADIKAREAIWRANRREHREIDELHAAGADRLRDAFGRAFGGNA